MDVFSTVTDVRLAGNGFNERILSRQIERTRSG